MTTLHKNNHSEKFKSYCLGSAEEEIIGKGKEKAELVEVFVAVLPLIRDVSGRGSTHRY